MPTYDPLYVQFLHYFNVERDYFECHEVMEHLWLEEGRDPLYQGLLQVAVGLYHHRNGNVNGSVKLFSQAVDKLSLYPAQAAGIDLGKLLEESEEYRNGLRAAEERGAAGDYPFRDLDIVILDPELKRLVDELRLNPPAREEH